MFCARAPWFCSLAAGLLSFPAVAAAEPTADRETASTWYGWQTLSFDGAALSVIGVGAAVAAADGPGEAIAAAVGLGATSFVLATPIVHASHGRTKEGLLSFAMRSGGMLVSGFTVGAIYSGVACNASPTACGGDFGGLYEFMIGAGLGLGVGAVAATAVDAAALGWEPTPDTHARKHDALRWAPTGGYDPHKRLATFGVQGAF